jgi:hypothetical protein
MNKIPLIIERTKSWYKDHRWQGRTALVFLVLILVLGIARLLLPQTIIYSTTSWLKKQGIDSTIETINIDIIDGTVSLVNARGLKDGEPLFNIGLVEIFWYWAPLSEKTVVISKVGLDQLSVNIQQYSDRIIVGGVTIPLGPGNDTEKAAGDINNPEEQAEPWAASIGEVIFTGLNICYLQHTASFEQANSNSLFVDYCVGLEEMSWAGTISYATDKTLLKSGELPVSSTGNFTLSGLYITDNKLNKKLLVSKYNALDNVAINGLNTIHIDELEMEGLSLLQRDDDKHIDSIRFSQLTIDDISLSNMNTLAINKIALSEPGLYLIKQDNTDWEYQQWIPQSPAASKATEQAETSKKVPDATTFKVTLNGLGINDSDLCYQDNSTSLYYCLTFADLAWQGPVKFDTRPAESGGDKLSLKGDLKLSRSNVHNHAIDRDLVDIDSVSLSGLDVSAIDNVALKSFSIDKLAALQRSKDNDDDTASFDTLAIDDIRYTSNKIEINAIDLQGLATTVSKNKDGSWEHDKWKPHSKKTAENNDAETEQQASKDEPFAIALKKAKLDSEKEISFTDNSTEPAMRVGLNKITFDLSDVYSDKPDSNSQFKLYAKTFKHSTIDIAGTVKPFAEKISFDADGKLKGFDLRVASPAAKQAIGHIIKSGQMDADLKLLAVDGVLDSNIGLSLYHFNIKATSKENADKLDARFGMPLNQTLVLLRDKDDSIHLDIPITGDVNNPSFEPMDAIFKATSKAATVTLITFYTPYGLIYAGGNVAFNLATALNFDPIDFAPGSAEVLAKGKEELDNLSKLLTEKPQVHLTMCGITNTQDLFTLYPEVKEKFDGNKKEGKSGDDIVLTAEQSTMLEKLANDRQVNSKNYLINSGGIAHDRLILCAPEHRTGDDAISGVEINI